MLNTDEVKILVQLICEKQTAMIRDNHSSFADEEYIGLERLKVKIKDLEVKSC